MLSLSNLGLCTTSMQRIIYHEKNATLRGRVKAPNYGFKKKEKKRERKRKKKKEKSSACVEIKKNQKKMHIKACEKKLEIKMIRLV